METDVQALEAEGWAAVPVGPFSRSIGQIWSREHVGRTQVAVLIDAFTANENMGIAHGGAMLTFADIALGYASGQATGNAHFATAQLQYQFAGAVQVGEFVICDVELVRQTSQLIFVRGLMTVEGRTIGAADAVFKVLDQAKMAKLKAG